MLITVCFCSNARLCSNPIWAYWLKQYFPPRRVFEPMTSDFKGRKSFEPNPWRHFLRILCSFSTDGISSFLSKKFYRPKNNSTTLLFQLSKDKFFGSVAERVKASCGTQVFGLRGKARQLNPSKLIKAWGAA